MTFLKPFFRDPKTRHLSREEEVEAFRLWRESGSLADRDRIILTHLALVDKIARYERYRYGYEVKVLASEGILGLFRALQSFDPSRGFRFATYASFWIRVYMRDFALKAHSVVRRPAPRPRPGSSSEEAQEGRETFQTDVSLDKDDAEDGTSWVENLPDQRPTPEEVAFRQAERRGEKMGIEQALQTLTEKERWVVTKRFQGEKPCPFASLAGELGLSLEGARQIEKRALAKLKKTLVRAKLVQVA